MFNVCLYSRALQTRVQSPYKDYKCVSCNINNHIYLYIEYLFNNEIIKTEVFSELTNTNSKIRHIALLYSIKYFGISSIPKHLKNDPFFKIRKECIENLNIQDLIFYLDDVNDEIILKALEVLLERYCKFIEYFNDTQKFKELDTKIKENDKNFKTTPNKFKEIDKSDLESLCKKVTKFMTSQNNQIRILTSKLISIFYNLDIEIFYKLLFKKVENDISGTIVYGLEDEISQVRKNTIISLYIFYKKIIHKFYIKKIHKKISHGKNEDKTLEKNETSSQKNLEQALKKNRKKLGKKSEKKAHGKLEAQNEDQGTKLYKKQKEIYKICIEYFINTINDENEEVRNTAILLFYKMASFSKFKLQDDHIVQISYNIIDSPVTATDLNILGIFKNIKFKSAKVLRECIEKLMKKLDMKLLVNTLYEIFQNNVQLVYKKLYTCTIYAEKEQELINKSFVVKILISYVLSQRLNIKINKNIKKYFLYIKILINQPDINLRIKENLIKLITNKQNQDITNFKGYDGDGIKFMKMFYKGLIRRNLKGIIKLNEKFSNINITKEILTDNAKLIKFIEKIELNRIKRNNKNI
ncbi:transportin-1-like [Vairimorpha necatrix]|uniref:Transportin-1-like n=1 Tax=Vairimorpha necatrix TaxID=6039 RepID=A0AAX4JAJ1_9MICR